MNYQVSTILELQHRLKMRIPEWVIKTSAASFHFKVLQFFLAISFPHFILVISKKIILDHKIRLTSLSLSWVFTYVQQRCYFAGHSTLNVLSESCGQISVDKYCLDSACKLPSGFWNRAFTTLFFVLFQSWETKEALYSISLVVPVSLSRFLSFPSLLMYVNVICL